MPDPEVLQSDDALRSLTSAEIDTAIDHARRHPRNIVKSAKAALDMACSSAAVAESCHYKLPRGKGIEGPSVRFAEILVSTWGNCRVASRVLDTSGDHAVCQGLFIDLESNVQVLREVHRRLLDKNGRRYSDDMIVVTANAGCSIAYRNAVFSGIPRAVWQPAYAAVVERIKRGDGEPLEARVTKAIGFFSARGVGFEQVCRALGVSSVAEITAEHLVTLKGFATAIQEGADVHEFFEEQNLSFPGDEEDEDLDSLTPGGEESGAA